MGGAALLQLPSADRLQKLVESYPSLDNQDRRDLMAFFQQGGDYAPASGQIVGILKAMKDDMEANLKQAVADEEKEISVATEAIETKTARSGEIAVSVVQTKDALEDTTEELADVEKFIAQLESECATKEKEWAQRSKLRSQEISAISEAIGILNDDDALDVFKKAVPSALLQDQVGFLQRSDSLASKVHKAQAIIATAAGKRDDRHLDLLLFTLNSKLKQQAKGRAQGMEGVIKMIDDMVVLLGKDRKDDDKQKGFCEEELEKATDEESAAKEKKTSIEATISESKDAISEAIDAIATLEQDVKDLDKAVAEATEQRKEEHAEFLETQQLNEAAIQLIGKAKNRLQKFYNPTMYKAPPKKEMSMEEKIMQAGSFAEIQSHARSDEDLDSDVAPPQAPEAPGGTYKKSEKSAGVMGLMDMMVGELESDMKDAEYEEKTAQDDYMKLMSNSQATREANTKGITAKEVAKSEMESKLDALKGTLTDTDQDLSLIASTLQDLHGACDFLLQNYDLRKEARTNEVESLKNAKAILSGANFR